MTDRFHQRERQLEDKARQTAALRASLLQQEEVESLGGLEEKAASLAQRETALRQENKTLAQQLEQAERLLQSLEQYTRLEEAAQEAGKSLARAQAAWKELEGREIQPGTSGNRPRHCGSRRWPWPRKAPRLGEQKEELLRAQAAGKQAAATRKQLEEQRQSLAALGQQRETLSQRMEKGNAFCKACEEAAARLPALLERRQALEKLSAAWEELARRKARQAAALEGLSIAEQAAAKSSFCWKRCPAAGAPRRRCCVKTPPCSWPTPWSRASPVPCAGPWSTPPPPRARRRCWSHGSWSPCAKRRKAPARPR